MYYLFMGKTDYQLRFSSMHKSRMYDKDLRSKKANKVISVLKDYLGETENLVHLDLGCSTGIMTKLYSKAFKDSTGIDIDDEAIEFASSKNNSNRLRFSVGDAMNTGLEECRFDVITCSHVYEHVPDSKKLMAEIYRLLKPGGVCFFAAGNRFVFMEGHYHLPLLSALPKSFAHIYIRVSREADYYYENLLSYWKLKKLVSHFEVIDYTQKIIERPDKFFATDIVKSGSKKQKVALALIDLAYWLCPTYIWILKKPTRDNGNAKS